VFNTRDTLSQAYALRAIWVIDAYLEALQCPETSKARWNLACLLLS